MHTIVDGGWLEAHGNSSRMLTTSAATTTLNSTPLPGEAGLCSGNRFKVAAKANPWFKDGR